jgi:hypothetical protein
MPGFPALEMRGQVEGTVRPRPAPHDVNHDTAASPGCQGIYDRFIKNYQNPGVCARRPRGASTLRSSTEARGEERSLLPAKNTRLHDIAMWGGACGEEALAIDNAELSGQAPTYAQGRRGEPGVAGAINAQEFEIGGFAGGNEGRTGERARGHKTLLRRCLKIAAGTRMAGRRSRKWQQEAVMCGISADFAGLAPVAAGRRGPGERPKPAISGPGRCCNAVATSVSDGTVGSYHELALRGWVHAPRGSGAKMRKR